MGGLEEDTQLIREIADFSGLTPAAISREIGVAKTTINRPFNGSATTRLSGPTLEKLRERFPDFPGWTRALEQRLPFRHQLVEKSTRERDDDSLAIPMIELAYGMGGTFLDDIDAGETVERFPRAFVRMYTSSPADQLVFSHGIGDSMEPTIGDRDLLLIDRSRDAIRMNDQIWAIATGGIGMVKRVRVESNGEVVLLSDNQNVPAQRIGDDELTVIGRVIAIVKRI